MLLAISDAHWQIGTTLRHLSTVFKRTSCLATNIFIFHSKYSHEMNLLNVWLLLFIIELLLLVNLVRNNMLPLCTFFNINLYVIQYLIKRRCRWKYIYNSILLLSYSTLAFKKTQAYLNVIWKLSLNLINLTLNTLFIIVVCQPECKRKNCCYLIRIAALQLRHPLQT